MAVEELSARTGLDEKETLELPVKSGEAEELHESIEELRRLNFIRTVDGEVKLNIPVMGGRQEAVDESS